jgi:hypothetical protein
MERFLRNYKTALAIAALAISTAAMANAQWTFVNFTVPQTGAKSPAPYGIDNQNDIVGVYANPDIRRGATFGFLRTGGNPAQWTLLTDPDPAGKILEPLGVNSSHTVVGYYQPVKGLIDGFIYSGGTYNTLNQPGCKDSYVSGINDKGDMAGFCYNPKTFQSWFYTAKNGLTTFYKIPGSVDTYATAINSIEWVGGWYFDGTSTHGYVRTSKGGVTTYDFPGAGQTWVYGVSDVSSRDDQWVAGYFENPDGSFHGFLNLNGTYTQIDVPGSTSTSVTGVNVHGWFVGTYRDASGKYHGYYAKPSNAASVLIDEE